MKVKPRIVFFLSVASAVLASGTATARVPTHVACVGDSITAGVGASTSNANYPGVLQSLLGGNVQVKNFGRSAATLLSVGDLPYQQQSEYTAATSFASGAGPSAVVDVIIMLGTNDSKPYNWTVGASSRAEQFRKDCAAMVDHFSQLATHPLVYLALPPRAYNNTFQISGTVIHDQILPIIKQVAAEKAVPVIDIDTPTGGHPEYFPDGVHPNDAGYKVLAQTMRDGLLASSGGAGGSSGTGTGGSSGTAGSGTSTGGAPRGGSSGLGGASGIAGNGGVGGRGGSAASGSGGATAGASSGGATAGSASGAARAGTTGSTGDASAGGSGGAGTGTGGASSRGGEPGTGGASRVGGAMSSGGSSSVAHGSGGASSAAGSSSPSAAGGSNGCSFAVGQAVQARALALVLAMVCVAGLARRRRR